MAQNNDFDGGYSDSTIEESDTDESSGNRQPQVVVLIREAISDEPPNLPDESPEIAANISPASPVKEKQLEPEAKHAKMSGNSDSEEENDSRKICPICMDVWTNCGSHRLVCLRCGHLFGYSCIVRWLEVGCSSGQRRCPQCNKRAHKRDIRTLYVHNLLVRDTTEFEKLKEELEIVRQEKTNAEIELAKANLRNQLQREELKVALSTITALESKLKDPSLSQNSQSNSQSAPVSRMVLEKSFNLSTTSGSRVLTYSPSLKFLYASVKLSNNLFTGFSVGKIDMNADRLMFGSCIYLHTQAIRDLALRPLSNDLLLSVSLDKTAKLLDTSSNTVVHKITAEHPLWSCCWEAENLNRFFIGSQSGIVLQYDSRQCSSPLNQIVVPGDLSPVSSLASVSSCATQSMPRGGLLVSKLISCWAHSLNSSGSFDSYQLPMEGPFTSLCYDEETGHVLVSKRPNTKSPNIWHTIYELDNKSPDVMCNPIHSFLGGTTQSQLTRPCLTKVCNDTLVAAYVESSRSLQTWSVSSRQTVATVKTSDVVLDVCPFAFNNKQYFATLSDRMLRLYSVQ